MVGHRLYHDHARYYDAVIGRFVSQDPMGFAAGDTNLYRYVGNAPTIRTDPSGKLVTIAIGAGLGAAAGLVTGVTIQSVNHWYYGAPFLWSRVGYATAVGAGVGTVIGGGFWTFGGVAALGSSSLTTLARAGSGTFTTIGGSNISLVVPGAIAGAVSR